MLRTLARRAAQTAAEVAQPPRPTSVYLEQMAKLHPPRKVWPPDFQRLAPQQRLRFEKKYKRRLRLATTSPRWVKFTKLAQLFSLVVVLGYVLLFMEAEDSRQAQTLDYMRTKLWNAFGLEYVPSAQQPKKTPSSPPQARPF